MRGILLVNARIVNEGAVKEGDLFIRNERIEKIGGDLSQVQADRVIDAEGAYLLPGAIDDQVHFREPGMTHKADIFTESRAAVAGGVTSFMEMPNTKPPVLTREKLEEKYQIAARNSAANYSFYMGASNDNLTEVLKTDVRSVCGIKVFMGSSTGNMLVDDERTLENIFREAPMIVAAHCEDEKTIKANEAAMRNKFGEDVPLKYHPMIRSEAACFLSSSLAVELATRYGTKLHILHISTGKETGLFERGSVLDKNITAEACVHHLYFDDSDYDEKGTLIKWNPAVKTVADREAIFQALLDDKIDVIATDHAPHTLAEKQNTYFHAPSGGPLVQHSLAAMLEFYLDGKIAIEKVVEKMSHNPALLFQVKERGFIREGYFADLAMVTTNQPWRVEKANILYKCGWSPFEGKTFRSQVTHTFVSGRLAYERGRFDDSVRGKRLTFIR